MFVVFFGSFYLINLVLAVVAVSYQQEVVAMQERVRDVFMKALLPRLFHSPSDGVRSFTTSVA